MAEQVLTKQGGGAERGGALTGRVGTPLTEQDSWLALVSLPGWEQRDGIRRGAHVRVKLGWVLSRWWKTRVQRPLHRDGLLVYTLPLSVPLSHPKTLQAADPLMGSPSSYVSLVYPWLPSSSRAPRTRVRPRTPRPTHQPKCFHPSSPCTPCPAWLPS